MTTTFWTLLISVAAGVATAGESLAESLQPASDTSRTDAAKILRTATAIGRKHLRSIIRTLYFLNNK
jgi:hypothetical protein